MEIRIDADGVLNAARQWDRIPARITQAQYRAWITLRRRWPVIARRDIQREYALTAQRIRAGLRLRTVAQGVQLIGSTRGIGLHQFRARPSRDGLRYTALKGRPRVRQGGFEQMHRGTPVAFERVPLAHGKRVPRTPIRRLYGPSVAQMLRKGDRPQRVAQAGLEVITAELHRQLSLPASE
jgi:hypothetical protein